MKTEHHVLVAGSDAGLLAAAKAAVRQLGKVGIEVAPKGSLATLAARAFEAIAVIAVVAPSESGAIEDFHRLARSLPERKVIAAAQNASGEDVRRLFRAGAADVLTAPFVPETVLASLTELLRQQMAPSAEHGRVVSFIKTAGGAGATTLALNFAALLAEGDERRRRPPLSTAVLDLDVQFGDTDVALDLQPRSSLIDVLRAPGRVDARFLQTVMTDHPSGLKLLAPTTSVVPVDALTPETAVGLIDHSAASFERTFVDLPATWSDWTFRVLARSDVIVLVSPPTVAGAVGARRVLEALQEAHIDRPLFFALNKLNGVIDAFEKPSRIGRTLDMGVDASLAFDALAAKAADRGKLVVEAFPNSRVAKDMKNATAKLEGRLEAMEDGVAISEVAA